MKRRYRIWSDGEDMQHPMKGYVNGFIDDSKEAIEKLTLHRSGDSKALYELHMFEWNAKKKDYVFTKVYGNTFTINTEIKN